MSCGNVIVIEEHSDDDNDDLDPVQVIIRECRFEYRVTLLILVDCADVEDLL